MKTFLLIATFCAFTSIAFAQTPSAELCPPGMVRVPERKHTCIDKYEWPNKRGGNPTVGMPAMPVWRDKLTKTFNAKALCESVGKRLCSVNEWINSCKGPGGSKYPFGDELPDPRYTTPENAPCNYAQWYRGRNEPAINRRDKKEFARLWQGDKSGARGCVSESGAEDMMGNVEEWVSCWKRGDTGKLTERSMCLMGRFWSQPYRCDQVIRGHDPKYFDYETGTRCCADTIILPNIPSLDLLESAPLPNPDLSPGEFSPFRGGFLEPVYPLPIFQPAFPYHSVPVGFLFAHLSAGVPYDLFRSTRDDHAGDDHQRSAWYPAQR